MRIMEPSPGFTLRVAGTNNMSDNLVMGIWIALFLVIMVGVLILSDMRTDAVMNFGDCIDKKALEDEFVGSLSEAWETYAEYCSK